MSYIIEIEIDNMTKDEAKSLLEVAKKKLEKGICINISNENNYSLGIMSSEVASFMIESVSTVSLSLLANTIYDILNPYRNREIYIDGNQIEDMSSKEIEKIITPQNTDSDTDSDKNG